jgi:UDP-N-acetylglucosamine--N-acetylmuramyl-(pentapeptide) pyrophosphoryl-undecaprenol N-acetylglucosamine transferase
MVSGGGTGGHIMPALALCEALLTRAPHAVLWYIGRGRSMEERLARNLGLPFRRIHAAPLKHGIRAAMAFVVAMVVGVCESLVLVLRGRPDVIIGFGGYASFPILLAGLILRRTVVVHEANARPGRTVKFLVRLGARLAYGMPPVDTTGPLALMVQRLGARACWTGNPVRRSFLQATSGTAHRLTGFVGTAPTLLVLGGSQGAHALNSVVPRAAALAARRVPGLRVAHLAGSADEHDVRAAYMAAGVPHFVAAFFDDMGGLYRLATMVVARAGALTVSEICVAGLPAVLVPLPTATDDHQTANAQVLERNGGAVLIPQPALTPESLADVIADVMAGEGRAEAMARANKACARPGAADDLIDWIKQLTGL